MVEVGVVARRAVTRLREVDQGYVSGMEEVNVAKLPTALKVLKATQVSAFHMVVVAGVSLWAVQREHRGAPCSAKLMGVASVACMMEVEYAQRVCMEALSFVLHMVVGNGVQLRDVVKVQGGAQIIVWNMVGANVARLMGVVRVHKGAQIFARHMGVVRDVSGVLKVPLLQIL
jgi:hypothetical protein